MNSVAFQGPGLGVAPVTSASAATTLGPNLSRKSLRLVEPTGQAVRADPHPQRDLSSAVRLQKTDAEKSGDAKAKDGFQLSDAALELLSRLDPALERLVREQQVHTLPAQDEKPKENGRHDGGALSTPSTDQMAFRAKVIAHLRRIYGDDPAFERAMAMGTVVVRAVQEGGDPGLQPEVAYQLYRHGTGQDSAQAAHPVRRRGNPATGVGKGDFIAWWPK